MAGVLEHLRWPPVRRQPVVPSVRVNTAVLELEAAKEILAEIFGARPGEVEEMIRQRLEDRSNAYSPGV
jgi:ribose 1,5-bisphosphokinase PhnN